MPRETHHATEAAACIKISCPGKEGITEVSALFAEIVLSLPYYNEAAKSSEVSKYSPSRLEQMIDTDMGSVQVVTVDMRIAGFCFSNIDDGLIWLSWFGVKPEFRRRGIGTTLLSALDERAKRAGAHKIWCDCRTNNVASRVTLANSGYREIGTLFNHWYGQDFLLWEHSVV
jgi:RimJ/RimL family protein N-acetyltransferase